MKRAAVIALFACGLLVVSANSQKYYKCIGSDGWGIGTNYEQLFSNYNLKVISGAIYSIDTVTPMRTMGQGIQLILKDQGGQEIYVHLGPRWFITHQDMNLAPGDQVEINAARFSLDGKDVYAAFEVRTATKTLLLRSYDDGYPYWCGWRKRKQ